VKRVRLLYHSIRHTRTRQLLGRLGLLLKRRALSRVLGPRRLPATLPAGQVPPLLRQIPAPVAPPRAELAVFEGGWPALRVLNRVIPLAHPVDWHPPALEAGTRLEKLNLHYMEFLEGLDAREFARVVDDWIDHNPRYRPGYWRDGWNSYALSIRCVVWMQQMRARRGRIGEDVAGRMAASLFLQLRFLRANLEVDIGGNHLIKNVKALLWGARVFTGSEARAWGQTGARLLTRELREQVLPDGVHYERSPAYHAQVFMDLLECRHVLPPGAAREALDAVLHRMAAAAANLAHPDGLPSLFNDGGLHMTYAPAACLDVYARLLGRAPPTAPPVFAHPHAGYYGARAGQDYVLVDCGDVSPDYLPAHAHGDMLAFEWTLAGNRMVVDAGVYEYHAGACRDYSRSTRAHNTVTVADEDQCEFWGAFRMARRGRGRAERYEAGDQGFVLVGTHDGYSRLPGRPVHRRRFDASPRRIEVADVVEGGAGQPVRSRLLLHPECVVKPDLDGVTVTRGGAAFRMTSPVPVRVQDAWWMPDFGVRLPTRQLVLDYGAAPCKGGFVLEAL
jgi:uncharacterized heparinase superfamily protein